MLDAVHVTVEGPGSVPWKCGVLSGRGMFNRGSELAKLTRYTELSGEEVVLFVAKDRLPDVVDGQIQIGEPDLAAANTVQLTDPSFYIAKRVPIDDGLIHALALEGGPAL